MVLSVTGETAGGARRDNDETQGSLLCIRAASVVHLELLNETHALAHSTPTWGGERVSRDACLATGKRVRYQAEKIGVVSRRL